MESTNYNEIQLKIKSLSAEIRSRPGMYFGDVHIKSFAHLLRTIVIDFFEYVGAINFSLSLYDEWKVKMRFEGISKTVDNNLIDPSRLWGQYHFTELHFLNPACIEMGYQAFDEHGTPLFYQKYQFGIMIEGLKSNEEYPAKSLEINFALDPNIWKFEAYWDYFSILDEFRDLGLVYKEKPFYLSLESETLQSCNTIHFSQGIIKLLNTSKMQSHNPSLLDGYLTLNHKLVKMELAFSFLEYYSKEPQFHSYVNHQRISHMFGVELKAVKLGLSNGIKKYLCEHKKEKIKVNPLIVGNHLAAVISLQLDEPCYGGSMKYSKLNNLEIIKPISTHLGAYIYAQMKEDEALARKIIERVENYP